MRRQLLLLLALIFCVSHSFPQRVISNTLPNDIDERCADTNPDMAKNKLSLKKTYHCANCPSDSCRLIEKAYYDIGGHLVKLQIGEDLNSGKITCEAVFEQLSDSTFESIARYRFGAKNLPYGLFLDTVINKKQKKILLYKVGKDSIITVRSVYLVDDESEIVSVKKYDTDNKLVLIFYPIENPVPLKVSIKTTGNRYDSVITRHEIYDQSEYESVIVYNRFKKKKEITYFNSGFQNKDTSIIRRQFIYDSKNRVMLIMEVDRDNQFVSQSRFYYNDSSLIRYTQDYDLTDTLVNEERKFNADQKLIYSQTLYPHRPAVFKWYYEYDNRGLLIRKKMYEEGLLEYCEYYEYE